MKGETVHPSAQMGRRTQKKRIDEAASAQAAGLGFRRDLLWGSVLVLAVFLAYLPVWRAGFVWDDEPVILINPVVVGPLGLKEIWTTRAADICPLTISTFWLEHALWGLDPLPYHLVNVALHGACAIVLWLVLRRMAVPGAWLGAALWALHPVEVETVAWVVELKNTESALFFLLAIYFYVREPKASRDWSYPLTLLFAALAMASKSSTVVLPVVLCLCAWWVRGRLPVRDLIGTGPLFLMSLAASLLSIWTQSLQLATSTDPRWVRTWPERLAAAGDAVWFYLGKLIWPHPLTTAYPRWHIDAGRPISFLPLAAVIVVWAVLWLKRASWSRPWFFAFTFFLVALLPALGLVDNYIFRFSLVFDHLQYLASMGPLALSGAGLAVGAERVLSGKPAVRSALAAVLLLTLGALSLQRASVFRNEQTLWSDTLAHNPDCAQAYINLGRFIDKQGRVDEAIADFRKAVALDPGSADDHTNLGKALKEKGQLADAMAEYRTVLAIDPNSVDARYNLGNGLLRDGHFLEAIEQFQQLVAIRPSYPKAHNNLAIALIQTGRTAEAIEQFRLELQYHPDDADTQKNLARAEAGASNAR